MILLRLQASRGDRKGDTSSSGSTGTPQQQQVADTPTRQRELAWKGAVCVASCVRCRASPASLLLAAATLVCRAPSCVLCRRSPVCCGVGTTFCGVGVFDSHQASVFPARSLCLCAVVRHLRRDAFPDVARAAKALKTAILALGTRASPQGSLPACVA